VYLVYECLDKEFLDKCHTPNIDTLEVHPAKSWARMTRGAVPLLLGGFLPTCDEKDCYHNNFHMMDPFFLSNVYKKMNLFLYISNGWVLEFFSDFIRPELRDKIMGWHRYHDTKAMIEDFIEREPELDNYFAYFHVMETHPPFYHPPERMPKNMVDDKTVSREEHRRLAVEYVDKISKPLYDLDTDLLVVTADHNLASGPKWHTDHFNVFIATRGEVIDRTKPKIWDIK